jgi:hypothetical protein
MMISSFMTLLTSSCIICLDARQHNKLVISIKRSTFSLLILFLSLSVPQSILSYPTQHPKTIFNSIFFSFLLVFSSEVGSFLLVSKLSFRFNSSFLLRLFRWWSLCNYHGLFICLLRFQVNLGRYE